MKFISFQVRNVSANDHFLAGISAPYNTDAYVDYFFDMMSL
jgi:hypothetical protein